MSVAAAVDAIVGAAIRLASVRLADEEADFDLNSVTPGVVGFVFTFIIAAATVFLVIDMNKRVRRTRYREEVRAKLEVERTSAAADAAASSDPTGS